MHKGLEAHKKIVTGLVLATLGAMAWWSSRGKPALTRLDWLGVLGLVLYERHITRVQVLGMGISDLGVLLWRRARCW